MFLILVLLQLTRFALGSIYFESAQFNANPKYMENFKFVLFNNTKGVSLFNMSSAQLVDFKKMTISISIKGSEGGKEFDKTYFQATVDTCNVAKGIFGNFIIKVVSDNLKQYSNYRFACPQEKGDYYVHNFPILDDKYFPPFLLRETGKIEVSAVIKAKIENVKQTIHMITMKIYGAIAN